MRGGGSERPPGLGLLPPGEPTAVPAPPPPSRAELPALERSVTRQEYFIFGCLGGWLPPNKQGRDEMTLVEQSVVAGSVVPGAREARWVCGRTQPPPARCPGSCGSCPAFWWVICVSP